MRKKIKAVKGGERVAALLIVLGTILYLGITAAFAQNSVVSDNGAKVAYDPDYLSFGDMYAFTETTYGNSNYGLSNATQTVSLYSSTAANATTAANFTFYQYYGSVTTGDHSNVTNGVEMKNHAYTEYNNGACAQSAAPAAVEGETVPVLTTTGTGVYTLVPGSTGSYRVYVYAESDPTGHVKYELIDSYAKANAYTGAPTQSLNFTRVADTDYWYAPVNVDTLSWSAYQLTAAKSGSSASSAAKDTNGAQPYAGSQKTNMTLNNDAYYYNVWTATEILYDTLLAIQFDSTVQLAPVTKLADTITITNSDDSMGSLTAVNAFGEPVAVGGAVTTVHAPIYITAAAASDEFAFSGFGDAELSLVDAEKGIYKYGFESAASLAGNWSKKEALPTVRISGSYTGTMDFFAATTASTQIVSGTQSSYTLTVDYTGAADTRSVTYTVTSAGSTVSSGTVTESSNTIRVSAQWDVVVVSITATGASGEAHTARFAINVSNEGLVDVAQIGTAKYQYIEDALAAATSGQTITIISPKVSFVGADTVPAAWTVDADGDGLPDGYTVKSGVTLIIPYSATGSTTLATNNDYPNSLCDWVSTSTTALATSESYEYRKLTLPANKTMYIKGAVATGGTLSATSGVSGGTNGSTSETYSVLEINGTVEVQDGGIVSSCGYIYGSGVLNAVSGAKLYQPMVIMDFRGGGYTVGAAGKSYAVGTQSGETYVSPFTRYVTQNIQSNVRMEDGALMYGYCDLYTGSTGGHNRTCGVLVGSTSKNVDGLIRLGTGAVLTTTYDKDDVVSTYARVGKLDVMIEGGASFGTLSLTAMSQSITTNELTFPVPYNYAFHLNGENSTYTIGYSLALLPGATLEVGEGATLDVGSSSSGFRFIAFDGFYDHTNSGGTNNPSTVTYGTQSGYSYPTTAALQAAGRSGTSDLIVYGTLNINSGVNFGGVVQAGSDSAKLVMSSAAAPSCKVQMGLIGDRAILVNHYYFAGATIRTLTAQVIDRGTGERTDITAGMTYYGAEGNNIIEDYTYDLYTTSASASTYETHTEALNAAVVGSWYNYTATIHTQKPDGSFAVSTAYFCHGADVSGYYLDEALTQPASTVTQDNMDLYSGQADALAMVVWADGSEESYYTSLRNAVQDAVHAGDTVVLLKDITLGTSVAIGKAQNLTVDLSGHTVAYSATPFVNSGTLTLDLGGSTITNNVDETYAAVPAFNNNAGGTAEVDLSGGTICVTIPEDDTSNVSVMVNNGSLTVDLGGGNIMLDHPASLTVGSQVISNAGSLTVKSTGEKGTLSTNVSRSTTTVVSATAETFAAVLRNSGAGSTMTLDNVILEQTQSGAALASVGIVNFNGAVIDSVKDTDIHVPYGYSIYNYGATIEAIQGGGFTSRYGIYNRNIRATTYTTAAGSTLSAVGAIGVIQDTDVAVSRYGIYNYGTIGEISGSASFTASPDASLGDSAVAGYAIYNSNLWYYDTALQKRMDSTSSGVLVRTDMYDTVNRPTIGRITGDVTVTAVNTGTGVDQGVALYNAGRISEISGNAVFQTSVSPSTTITYSRYAIQNTAGGIIEAISGNVTISAGDRALYNGSYMTGKTVTTYTTTSATTSKHTETTYIPSRIGNITGDTGGKGITIEAVVNQYGIINYNEIGDITGKVTITAEKSTYALSNQADGAYTSYVFDWSEDGTGTVKTYDYTRATSTIGTIGGGDSEILISSLNGYSLYNIGEIEAVRDGVTIQVVTGNTSYYAALYNGDGSQTAYAYTDTNLGANAVTSGRYDLKREYTYTYLETGGHIGIIEGTVTVTTPTRNALYNLGTIDRIGSGVHVNADDRYALNNTRHYVGTRDTVRYYYGASAFAATTQYFGETTLAYTMELANIGVIDGAAITANVYSVYNGGSIESIINSTITAEGERAISNSQVSTVSYEVTMDPFPVYSDGAYTGTVTDSVTRREAGVIGLIGGGNTISGTTNVVINSGKILAVDNTDAEGNVLENSTITATTGVAFYNYQGYGATSRVAAGTSTIADYVSAHIGTVKNVVINGNTYAVKNGDGSTIYPDVTIEELGEGLEAAAISSSTSYGVYNTSNAKLNAITGGIYTHTYANKYAVYNANTSTPIVISGGDFKGGTNNDATQGRGYAIYLPDTEARQTYPEGWGLSSAGMTRSVTFADGTTGTGYYYIRLLNAVAKIVDSGGFTEYASLADAVAAYPTTGMDGSVYIQMTEDSTEAGVAIDRDVYLDLNGKTVTLGENGLAIASGVTLYGMDCTTNDYTDTACGKISGSVDGSVALVYQTPAHADNTFERYVKIQDTAKNELSFQRYNISVSGYRFDFNENGTSALYFQGTFSGSGAVKDLLKDIGFRMDGEDVWWTAQAELSDLTEEKYEIQIALVGDFTMDDLKAPHTIYALADFIGDQMNPAASDPKTLSFWEALQKYYEELKAKLDRSPEEEADLAVLERVLNGAEPTEASEADN